MEMKIAKLQNFDENIFKLLMKHNGHFESGAVQRHANLVDLEKSEKLRVLSLS